jgi:hypothetical protein
LSSFALKDQFVFNIDDFQVLCLQQNLEFVPSKNIFFELLCCLSLPGSFPIALPPPLPRPSCDKHYRLPQAGFRVKKKAQATKGQIATVRGRAAGEGISFPSRAVPKARSHSW